VGVQSSIVAVPAALQASASVRAVVQVAPEVQAARLALPDGVPCTPRGVRLRARPRVLVQEWVHAPALVLVPASARGPAWEQAQVA